MKFRELWQLSRVIFTELSFQAIYSLRLGSSLPSRRKASVKQVIRNAQFNTLISKILTTVFICVFGFTVFVPFLVTSGPSYPAKDVAFAGSLSAFLASVLFLIVFMGVQVATSIISSEVGDVLMPLPLTKKDISRIIFICFVRIFDIPLIAGAAILLSSYYLVGGTLLGGLVCLAAIITTEALGVILTVGLAKFFYSRVASGRGKSKWKAFLRVVYMFVWIIPTFGVYIVINFATAIVEIFASVTQGLSVYLQGIVLVYPFSFGFLASFATFSQEIDQGLFVLSAVASLMYFALAAYALKWVVATMRQIGGRGLGVTSREEVKDTIIKPRAPWLSVIRKDLRIASRSPAYASLFLLPAAQAVILAVSFSSIDQGLGATLGMLSGVSIMTLLLPPTLFSIEGLASVYTRSLPLKKRTFIVAKTALTMLIYTASLAALVVVGLLFSRDFSTILIYAAIHAFSISAGSMLEQLILAHRFWREAFALGNIYSRLSTLVVVVLPGLIVAAIPMIAATIALLTAESIILQVFFAAAFVEFAVMTFIVLWQNRR